MGKEIEAKFLKIYANLSIKDRNEIIVVINNEPFTWNSAELEIEQDTLIGKKILTKLVKLGILKKDGNRP